jgi:hypothetical protein
VKSNSRSIEDSSSVSLAEDIEVHAVAVLPLLSDELDEWPRRRPNEDFTCRFTGSSTKLNFRLTPFGEDGKKVARPDESSRKVGSAQYTTLSPDPPRWMELHRFSNAFNCGLAVEPKLWNLASMTK